MLTRQCQGQEHHAEVENMHLLKGWRAKAQSPVEAAHVKCSPCAKASNDTQISSLLFEGHSSTRCPLCHSRNY